MTTQPQSESVLYLDKAGQEDANSVTMLRILDVLYSIHAKLDEPGFKRLVQKHKDGGLIGPVVHFDPENLLDKD